MSRRRDAMSWLVIALVLVIVGTGALFMLWPQLQPHTTLRLGDGVFLTRVAKTQTDREKGLNGGRLGSDQALLLVYESDDRWPVTMQNSPIPLDIVWLNNDKQVVYIEKNVPVESSPYTMDTPKDPARYVVELPAGTVDRKAITLNSTALFDENNVQGLQI